MKDRLSGIKALLARNEELHRKMKWLYEQGEEEEFYHLNEEFLANAQLINARLSDAWPE